MKIRSVIVLENAVTQAQAYYYELQAFHNGLQSRRREAEKTLSISKDEKQTAKLNYKQARLNAVQEA